MTIDTHAHVFRRGLELADIRRYAPDYDAEIEDYLRQLDANAVTRGVLVQPSFLGTDNSFMLEALRQHPARLRGIAMVPPDVATSELQRLAAGGVVGIRLNLVGLPLPDLRAEPWPALMRRVADQGWQVEVHREARDLASVIGPLLEAGVNVVVDHFGRPDPELSIADPGFGYLLSVAASRRVWVKLSAAYRNGAGGRGEAIARAAIPLLRDAFGLERLLWGSDWPHTQFESLITYGSTVSQVEVWLPDPAERSVVLKDTPTKLFHF
ncbi:MAG TPA: amidohydrolase family protein [Gemmatimonadales bacterium]|jgi:predicted TIM-barrel fold metal-dependent hydrolase|nr:amidohydrolase family protein [Gemmatimonadales bacterium]